MARSAQDIAGDVSAILSFDPSSALLDLLEAASEDDERTLTALRDFRQSPWTLPTLTYRLSDLLQSSPVTRARVDEIVEPLHRETEARHVADDAVTVLRHARGQVAMDLDAAVADCARGLPHLERAKANFDVHRVELHSAARFEQLLGDALVNDPSRLVAVSDAAARAVAGHVVQLWHGDEPTLRDQLATTFEWLAQSHAEIAEPITVFLSDSDDARANEALIESLARTARADSAARTLLLGPHADGRRRQRAVRDLILKNATITPEHRDPMRGHPGGSRSANDTPEAGIDAGAGADPATDAGSPTWEAYPVLRPAGVGPDDDFAITAGKPFPLEVGLGIDIDFGLAATGGLGDVAAGEPVVIQLAYDPESFTVDGDLPIVVTPDENDQYPVKTVTVTPRPQGKDGGPNRRIAAHFLIGGSLRGIAVRTFRVAGTPKISIATSPSMIDLSALSGENPPDVIVAIYRADVSTTGTYTVAVFPRSLDGPLPPVERIELGGEAGVYIADFYDLAEAEGDAVTRYETLVGRAVKFGARIPRATRAALQRLAQEAKKSSPATMLLLTEDNLVPWELASFPRDEAISTAAGGDSPFLGAHFAIGRWPIDVQTKSSKRPDAEPVDVRRTALVTADYSDGWAPLPHAQKEITSLAKSYAPAEVWKPGRSELLGRLSEDVDVFHFALHGTADPRDIQDGLVLMDDSGGDPKAVYLGSSILRTRIRKDPPTLPRRPFIFLNACKVGRTQQSLADYGGLAAVFLEAGARAVVACLWDIDDNLAGTISKQFYKSADRHVAPAEILRRVRAKYLVTETDAAAAATPTLIAYQYFGHPNLRVSRPRRGD